MHLPSSRCIHCISFFQAFTSCSPIWASDSRAPFRPIVFSMIILKDWLELWMACRYSNPQKHSQMFPKYKKRRKSPLPRKTYKKHEVNTSKTSQNTETNHVSAVHR